MNLQGKPFAVNKGAPVIHPGIATGIVIAFGPRELSDCDPDSRVSLLEPAESYHPRSESLSKRSVHTTVCRDDLKSAREEERSCVRRRAPRGARYVLRGTRHHHKLSGHVRLQWVCAFRAEVYPSGVGFRDRLGFLVAWELACPCEWTAMTSPAVGIGYNGQTLACQYLSESAKGNDSSCVLRAGSAC